MQEIKLTTTSTQDIVKKIYEDTYRVEVKVETNGKLPSKVRQTDAGFDVYATEDVTLYPGQSGKTPLNIRLKLPKSTYAEITTKSGLGSKGHSVRAGIIDEEYRGIVHVIHSNVNVVNIVDNSLIKMNTEPLVIKKGEKLAQMIVHPYSSNYYIEEVKELDTATSRGEGGFGSTGSH